MSRIKTVCLVALCLALLAVGVSAQGGPVLVNPSFEGGWHIQGRPEKEIPNGWTLADVEGSHPWCPTAPCHAPEVKPNEEFVTDGRYSMRTFTTFSHGLYAIWQEQPAEPGAWYTFSCKVRIDSNPSGQLAGYVGIQPWGNGNVFERQMIWGKEEQRQLAWYTVSVTAPAYGSKIVVAMGGNNRWATKDNTLWWDQCTLTRADGPGPEPTPQPTVTPEPCPTCVPGGSCDLEKIKKIVERALIERPPVLWPR